MYWKREKENAMIRRMKLAKAISKLWMNVQLIVKATQGCLSMRLRRIDAAPTDMDTDVIVRHLQGPKLVRKSIMRATTCTNLHNLGRLSL